MHSDRSTDPHVLAFLEGAEATFNDAEKSLAELEPAWAKSALFFRTGVRAGHAKGSLRMRSLGQVWEMLEVYRHRSQSGDTLSLLHAIKICAQENLPLPTWLAIAYEEALDRFLKPGGETHLDQVFVSANLPTNTQKKAAQARQDWQLGVQLYHAAWERARKDESLDSFHAVMTAVLAAQDFGVGITKAKELFEAIERNQLELLGKKMNEGLSRFLEIRRKV